MRDSSCATHPTPSWHNYLLLPTKTVAFVIFIVMFCCSQQWSMQCLMVHGLLGFILTAALVLLLLLLLIHQFSLSVHLLLWNWKIVLHFDDNNILLDLHVILVTIYYSKIHHIDILSLFDFYIIPIENQFDW